MNISRTRITTVLIGVLALGTGCSDFTWPENTGAAVANYATIVEASYSDSLMTAMALNTALVALVDSPSQATLDAARQAWLDSREPYLQTEVYRFYDGPIDNPTDGPEGAINAWPLDENFIDYVEGDPNAGIINGSGTIDAATLAELNEKDGNEANVATGYHAIEFLLWGQDGSATGPGDRPYTDYVTDGTGTAANQDRRGQYLKVAGELLVAHIGQVHSAWVEGAAYRTAFQADAQAAFKKILTGMIVLSGFETGSERLKAALDSGNQEDEHSCFSDNTHRDMIQDIQGVWNVWTGTYVRTDGTQIKGTAIKDVVSAVNADLAARVDARILESLSLAKALQVPFDQEIIAGSAGRDRVLALILSLQELEKTLFEVFDAFGLTVVIPE